MSSTSRARPAPSGSQPVETRNFFIASSAILVRAAMAAWLFPEMMESCAAGPGVAVAVNDTGPVPLEETMAVCVPASVPNVHAVLASPLAFVVAEVGLTEPLLPPAAKSTVALGTGAPVPSSNRTTSGAGSTVLTAPVWPLPHSPSLR